ncbi:cobalamin B12-binding domain-containing protein [Sulfitobacter sp. JB4-11]|uniref:cobalamin B12-binding domain-containing protein n=1 Tax=Sulfitobacter rhodophyticola TaxID=3238304 RepID=UPI003D81C0E7
MPLSDDNSSLITERDLSAIQADFDTLRAQLPTDAVASLAREVLTRVSQQSRPVRQSAASLEKLANALISADDAPLQALVEQYRRSNLRIEVLYLRHLAPAAKLLGEWWTQDRTSLSDVAIGTGRIYALMRAYNHRLPPPIRPSGKMAFFASVPGETHTLGVRMAADLYRRDGWNIDVEMGVPHDLLVDRIVSSGHLLVGLSAGGVHALPDLARLVLALRVSVPHALILVSGNIVAEAEDSIRLIHADAMSSSYEGARTALETLWERLSDASTDPA